MKSNRSILKSALIFICSLFLIVSAVFAIKPNVFAVKTDVAYASEVTPTIYWGFNDSDATLYVSSSPLDGTYSSTGNFASSGFSNWPKNMKTVVFESRVAPTSMIYWFYQATLLSSFVNLELLDTSNVTCFEDTFHTCLSLEYLVVVVV